MEHVITAEDSHDFEIKTTWLDWTMTLAQLFDHEDTEQLMQTEKLGPQFQAPSMQVNYFSN